MVFRRGARRKRVWGSRRGARRKRAVSGTMPLACRGYADTVRRYAACGVDITREPMLVAPAPHTSLGGVVIDARCRVLRADSTPVPGLFAAGEVTGGVHGRNRVGGNAGTEVLVFGRIAGESAAQYGKRPQ